MSIYKTRETHTDPPPSNLWLVGRSESNKAPAKEKTLKITLNCDLPVTRISKGRRALKNRNSFNLFFFISQFYFICSFFFYYEYTRVKMGQKFARVFPGKMLKSLNFPDCTTTYTELNIQA